jgi:DNA-binding transcriptional ArsR family regulator
MELQMAKTKPDVDDTCANYLKALGDPTRLRIVKALQIGPLTVSDLAELLEVDMQKVSHHLRILFHADLLTLQREGKFRYYELNSNFVKRRQSSNALDLGCCTLGLRGD